MAKTKKEEAQQGALKSINIRDVFGEVSRENIGQTLFVIRGVATEVFTHLNKFGENVGLKGDFVAIHGVTGEVFTANAAFLPNGITKQVVKKLENGDYEVEFSAEIQCVSSDKNSKGIAYIAEEPRTEQRLKRQQDLMQWASQNAQKLIAN